MTSSSNISGDNRQGSRLKKVNTRYFSFKWKSDSNESTSQKNNDDDNNLNTMDHLNDCKKTTNNGFFRNIKKNLSVKIFYKFKRRIKNSETTNENNNNNSNGEDDDGGDDDSDSDDDTNKLTTTCNNVDRNTSEIDERIGASNVPVVSEQNNSLVTSNEGSSGETSTSQTTTTTATSTSTTDDNYNLQNNRSTSQVVNRSVGLSQELLKLHKFGWYWGGIQRDVAEEKLNHHPDGSFLIRDSENHRYLLTLSFKSAGKTLHSRIEHRDGKFSLCNNGNNNGTHQSLSNGSFTSIADLIEHSMDSSENRIFCYSRPRYPGHPAFPVRLTTPISRLTQVKSLQYLCRFVIRRNTRLDNINKLPLPNKIKEFLEENYL